MPIFGLGLHVIVALYFAVHAIRNGQNMYWLFVLFAFPMLGSIVYFAAIYLPAIRQGRSGILAKRAFNQLVDPNRNLREARKAFDLLATVDNRLKLANALLDTGAADEALRHYQEAAQGPFARDPALLAGLARAQFSTQDAAGSLATLEALFAHRPEARRQPIPALLYARALAAGGSEASRSAFESALAVASDPEPKCHFADWLMARQDPADQDRARALYEEIIKDSRHWHSHAKSINKEWLQRARAGVAKATA
ncbi:hypothetical protein FNU76_06565 [Chitinimonas arctica]|uniref:Tetratricopeptide repeat protein n=1 Tax=Chitinimonas arctica TaxID=2594795 RepID=A0A516SD10_9NEIS|nr:hypothetical protein [Chitinimonas arctica]QDQ26036.1 hypothetical protein FNU76_06565 [Chitinimonas arctica]